MCKFVHMWKKRESYELSLTIEKQYTFAITPNSNVFENSRKKVKWCFRLHITSQYFRVDYILAARGLRYLKRYNTSRLAMRNVKCIIKYIRKFLVCMHILVTRHIHQALPVTSRLTMKQFQSLVKSVSLTFIFYR